MSYDLMVFRSETAPGTRIDFLKWYQNQTRWTEGHSYDDPANTSPELRNWFMEMIQIFPALNGPFANDKDDGDKVSDYSMGKDVIYVAFAWSEAENAHKTMLRLAQKHGVGFFDVSSDNGQIFFPTDGKLLPIQEPNLNLAKTNERNSEKEKKPWWKFW